MLPIRALSAKGYSVAKSELTPAQVSLIKKELTVSAVGPAALLPDSPVSKSTLNPPNDSIYPLPGVSHNLERR